MIIKFQPRNKQDENGVIVRNKVRLVAKGYSQIEGIAYEETFAPLARLDSIKILWAIACSLRIKLYQMDVKSAFLNEILSEEAYVEQPKGFEDPKFLNYVYWLKKPLYGLKKAPRAWYERLITYLLEKKYERRGVDRTLFIDRSNDELLVAQINVDYIVFGATCSDIAFSFAENKKTEFKLSMLDELSFFLGLQRWNLCFSIQVC